MRANITSIILAIFASGVLVSANIINVPSDYATIQAGIDASVDGDTVLVQPGTYAENISFRGHNIVVGSLFLITGDFRYIWLTVIDGDSNGSVVTFDNGEDSSSAINGFSLLNGHSTFGGGIYCNNSCGAILNNIISDNNAACGGGIFNLRSNSVIINNTISRNTSATMGGGIYINFSNPKIENNIINENSAGEGSGICCLNSNPIIQRNDIFGNMGQYWGSGIYSDNCSPYVNNNNLYQNGGGIYCFNNINATIINNIFDGNTKGGIRSRDCINLTIENNIVTGNSVFYDGGGIWGYNNAGMLIKYNLLAGNSAYGNEYHGNGGGIYLEYSSTLIVNNTITGNSSSLRGGGLCYRVSYVEIYNSIFWDDSSMENNEIGNYAGTLRVHYCDIEGGNQGDNNIDSDPLFVDPESGDYHLLAGSPCIDAGDPESPRDPDSTRADIGAYYFDQTVGINDGFVMLPSGFNLLQNYPNPFNGMTVISYSLPGFSHVKIEIYDILGRKLTSLLDMPQAAGMHQITWNANDLPSGIYFYKLQAGDISKSKKTILLK